MRVTSSRAYSRPAPVPKMPPGLMELMDGLAREVLMHNPNNVYEFCAGHMEKLLEMRDGPLSKKSLTLEQKIQKAQEKMREKARQRREKFDDDQEQRANNSSDIEKHIRETTPQNTISENPSLKIPNHQEVNLKNASEFEISHVPPEENLLHDMIDVSNTVELTSSNEEPQSIMKDNTNEQASPDISSKEKQEIYPEAIKQLDDEPIFGKVEKEVIDVIAPLKVPKPEDIVDIVTIDSPLQTITEAYEEISVNDSAVILPRITIGDEQDANLIVDEEFGDTKSDKINESIIENISEYSSTNPSKIQNASDVESFDGPDSEDLKNENEAIISNSAGDDEEAVSDFSKNNVDSSDFVSTNTEKINVPKVIDDLGDSNITYTTPNNLESNNADTLIVTTDMGESDKISTKEIINDQEKNMIEEQQKTTEVVIENLNNQDELPCDRTGIEVESKEAIDIEPKNVTITEDNSHTNSDPINKIAENEDNLEKAINIKDNNATTTDSECNMKSEKNICNESTGKETDIKVNSAAEDINMNTENEALNDQTDISSHVTTVTEPNVEWNSEIQSVVSDNPNGNPGKINDVIKLESEIITYSFKEGEENFDDDVEKHQDIIDLSLHKSDSTENTNEDSMSIIDSDLSKTDEDSQNNPNMDLETAAVTIQKVFRSFMFKSRNSTFEDNANYEQNSVDEDNKKKEEYYAAANLSKERRPLGITRMDTVLQTVNEEKSLSLSTDDSSTLSSAATTIQAHVRGFLVRNRLNSSKTFSMNSLVNSHEVFESDPDQHRNKTILNIHIVPEEGNYLSRDESLITSMDLSLDGSPPSSVNLHPMSCDITERRKMLKREDAVQSVTPPSNNSGKLSEDSVKEVLINENGVLEREPTDDKTIDIDDQLENEVGEVVSSASTVTPTTVITISKSEDPIRSPRDDTESSLRRNGRSLTKLSSDESDVITPFVPSPRSSDEDMKLTHSGEFHDVMLPTKVIRNDTSAVRGE